MNNNKIISSADAFRLSHGELTTVCIREKVAEAIKTSAEKHELMTDVYIPGEMPGAILKELIALGYSVHCYTNNVCQIGDTQYSKYTISWENG